MIRPIIHRQLTRGDLACLVAVRKRCQRELGERDQPLRGEQAQRLLRADLPRVLEEVRVSPQREREPLGEVGRMDRLRTRNRQVRGLL